MKTKHSMPITDYLSGIILCSLFATGTLLLSSCQSKKEPSSVLRILCGSSFAEPSQEIGRQFKEERGVPVEFDLGGCETLYPKIKTGSTADIFICHDPFEEKIKEGKAYDRSIPIATMRPMIAVRPGNPKNIHSIADLAQPGLKIGMGNPAYSTCGELFVKMLKQQNLYDAVMTNVLLQGRTHAEIANGMILGPLDAVVLWNFMSTMYKGKIEPLPPDANYENVRITIVGLKKSAHPKLRDEFLQWCSGTVAREAFLKNGYDPIF